MLGPLGHALIQSLRVELANTHYVTRLIDAGQPFIFLIWHSQLLLSVPAALRYGITGLASPTLDGQIGAGVAGRLGIDSISGDSRYRSLSALRGLAARLREGRSVGLFPDGPVGPARRLKQGPLILARRSGCPLIPTAASAAWRIGLQSHWDRFILPLPFSRVAAIAGEPVWVPGQTDDAELARLAVDLTGRMNALCEQADRLIGSGSRRSV